MPSINATPPNRSRRRKGLAARAIEIDPSIVLAHSLLARANGAEVMGGRAADREKGLRLAMGAAQRTIVSDSRNDTGHATLGYALSIAGRSDEAIEALEAFDTARNYRSGNWEPSVNAAVAAIAAGDTGRERAMVAEALELEPGLTMDLVRSSIPVLANPPLAEVADRLPEFGLPAGAT